MKKIILLLFVVLVFFSACGTENDSAETVVSTTEPHFENKTLSLPIDPDWFVLCCENTSSEISFSASAGWFLQYSLNTAFPIKNENDLVIAFDQDVPFVYYIEEVEPYQTSAPNEMVAALTYSGINWIELATRIQNCASDQEANQIIEESGIYSSAKINPDRELYAYKLRIQFEPISGVNDLHNLTISVNGHSKEYNIGTIHLTDEEPDGMPEVNTEKDCIQGYSIASSDASVLPTGELTICNFLEGISEDIVIKDIGFSTSDILLEKLEVKVEDANGNATTRLWTGDTFVNLDKGSNATLIFTMNVRNAAGHLTSNGQFFTYIHYETAEGEDICINWEINYRGRLDAPLAYYVSDALGFDLISYYTKFVPACEACEYLNH